MNNSLVTVGTVRNSGGVILNHLTVINSIKCGKTVFKNRFNSWEVSIARNILRVQNLIRDG